MTNKIKEVIETLYMQNMPVCISMPEYLNQILFFIIMSSAIGNVANNILKQNPKVNAPDEYLNLATGLRSAAETRTQENVGSAPLYRTHFL